MAPLPVFLPGEFHGQRSLSTAPPTEERATVHGVAKIQTQQLNNSSNITYLMFFLPLYRSILLNFTIFLLSNELL